MRVLAKNAKVAVRLEEAPGATSGGILLVERQRLARVGVVVSAGSLSVLSAGDRVVRSVFDCSSVEAEGCLVLDEDSLYCRVVDGRLEAFPGRLILALDPLGSSEIAVPERVRLKGYLMGRDCSLRYATVVSSGFEEYPVGARVLVRPDVYDCLQILPCDKDLPFVDVPEGGEVRVYKPDLETVMAQVPLLVC